MLSANRLLNALSVLERPALRIRPRQCTKLRHRLSGCTRCADVCRPQAISWSNTLEIDKDRCTGCGLCAAVCPTGALEAREPSGTELVARARDLAERTSTVAFACPTYLKGRKATAGPCLEVACLGRLDESVLVGTVAWGGKDVLLVDGACDGCPESAGRTLAEKAVQTAKELLSSRDTEASVSFVSDLPAGSGAQLTRAEAPDSGLSRRNFFGLLAGRAKQAGAVTIGTVLDLPETQPSHEGVKPGQLPVFVPARRQLLLAALRRLERKEPPPETGTDYWVQFDFTAKCDGCRMCALFCPTGALSKVGPDEKTGVGFRSSLCTDCKLCVDLCYRKAVTLAPEPDEAKAIAGAPRILPMPFARRPSGL